MHQPFIPRLQPLIIPPGRHADGNRAPGAFGKRRLSPVDQGLAMMRRWGIAIPEPEPNKHWSSARLKRAGLRKMRVIERGRRLTRIVPIED